MPRGRTCNPEANVLALGRAPDTSVVIFFKYSRFVDVVNLF